MSLPPTAAREPAPDPLSPEAAAARDQAWIALARQGDQAAFGELMQTHYPATHRLVVAILRDEHEARDVCQEVWITVWKNLKHYRSQSRFSTWLHPIAVRRAIDHLRKRQRWFSRFLPFASGRDDAPGIPEPAATDDSAAEALAAARRARFEQALASLPVRLRAALALREIEGLSYAEIALALDCPTGTVMSRLHQARRLLLKKLNGMTSPNPL